MFTSFDMKSFGSALRTIRESNKLSRCQVFKNLGLHTDTLRKIELGSVIPKYESLEMLSKLYKVDLLNLLRTHRYSCDLKSIYNDLDDFLINNKIHKIKELKNEINDNPNTYKLLFLDEYYLLTIFVDSVLIFHENTASKLNNLVSILEQHIDFSSLTKLSNGLITSPLTTRLANVLAMVKMRLSHYDTSIFILESILEIVRNDSMNLIYSYELEIKYCYSLSYCYFILNDYSTSLVYSKIGIEIAIKKQSLYMLYNLYSRKAASEFKLQIDTYKDSFEKCIHLLEILGEDSQKDNYIAIIRNKYIHDFLL